MILSMPHHDPTGRHNASFRRQLGALQARFSRICIGATGLTGVHNRPFLDWLVGQGVEVQFSQPGHPFGEPALAALALAVARNTSDEPVWYTFVDRLLFALETSWRKACLADLETRRTTGLLIVERSEAAWAAHPANYREIEGMQSRAFELLHGRWLELTPGAYLFNAAAARAAVEGATAKDAGVWTEWVLLAFKHGFCVETTPVDWLTWEDPYWEGVDGQVLKQQRESSQVETIKRIAWAAPVLRLLADERFSQIPKEAIQHGCARL